MVALFHVGNLLVGAVAFDAYHQRTKVVMRLNFSYVSLALVTSSADTGVGCSRLYLKRSTSLPFRMGVSLMGLAIINTYLCEISGAKTAVLGQAKRQSRAEREQ